MKAIILLIVGMIISITIFLVAFTVWTTTTGQLLSQYNSTIPTPTIDGTTWDDMNGIYLNVTRASGIMFVLFTVAVIIEYLLGAHQKEYEEYESYDKYR